MSTSKNHVDKNSDTPTLDGWDDDLGDLDTLGDGPHDSSSPASLPTQSLPQPPPPIHSSTNANPRIHPPGSSAPESSFPRSSSSFSSPLLEPVDPTDFPTPEQRLLAALIQNIPKHATEHHLEDFLACCGPTQMIRYVQSVTVDDAMDACIIFESEAGKDTALLLNGSEMLGSTIVTCVPPLKWKIKNFTEIFDLEDPDHSATRLDRMGSTSSSRYGKSPQIMAAKNQELDPLQNPLPSVKSTKPSKKDIQRVLNAVSEGQNKSSVIRIRSQNNQPTPQQTTTDTGFWNSLATALPQLRHELNELGKDFDFIKEELDQKFNFHQKASLSMTQVQDFAESTKIRAKELDSEWGLSQNAAKVSLNFTNLLQEKVKTMSAAPHANVNTISSLTDAEKNSTADSVSKGQTLSSWKSGWSSWFSDAYTGGEKEGTKIDQKNTINNPKDNVMNIGDSAKAPTDSEPSAFTDSSSSLEKSEDMSDSSLAKSLTKGSAENSEWVATTNPETPRTSSSHSTAA